MRYTAIVVKQSPVYISRDTGDQVHPTFLSDYVNHDFTFVCTKIAEHKADSRGELHEQLEKAKYGYNVEIYFYDNKAHTKRSR